MSVPKGRRQESRFEAQHHYYRLRSEVTTLILQDFGFSEEKYKKDIDRYRQNHETANNVDEVVERWQKKSDSFSRWFIDCEAEAVLDILRSIEREFTLGNSIYPSETPAKIMEFCMRRYHVNKAIGYCYTLKQELNYIIRTLPVDLNKFERFAEEIDRQIALYKGVRQSDNRLIKPKKDGTIDQDVFRDFDGIASVIRKIGKLEAKEKQ